MFRRVPRRTFLATAAGAAAVLHTPSHDKLSVYPAKNPDILLQETPSELETQIGAARRAVTGVYNEAHSRVQDVVSKWIGVENAVERRVKSIIAPDESLTPAVLYIGVSTLTGSIITRNRSPFLRFLLPPTLFFLSFHHFLPKTSTNFSNYLGGLEDRYLPRVAHIHDVSYAHTAMTWELIKSRTQDGREKVSGGVVGVVGKLQDATGLKLQEGLGWSSEKVKVAEQAIETKAEAVADIVEKGVLDTKEVIEEKVDDIKRLV